MLCGASRPRPRARKANRAMMPAGLLRSGPGVLSVRVAFEAAQGAVPRLSQSAERKLGPERRRSGTVSAHGT